MQARWLRFIAVTVMCFGLAASAAPSRLQAQERVDSDFKGAVGLGLVGAELGAVIPALAGLDSTWAFIVFPTIGAAGGALAGYFAIDHADHAELSVAVLTAGMALVIPALVVTLWATAYDPNDEPGTGQARRPSLASARDRRAAAVARAGSGVVRLADGELALAAPGVALVPSAQRGDVRLSGVNVSLLSGRF